MPRSLCAKYDRGVQDGFCLRDGRGGLYWLGTLRGYDGVEMYCIDYLFATNWGVAHKRITLSGTLPTSLGGSVAAATTAALTYVVTRNPASAVNDTTAAAIGLIIRQVMGDVRKTGGPGIPGGLTVSRDVRGVSFVNPAIVSRARALWAEARVRRGPWSVQVKVAAGPDGRFLPGEQVRATVRGTNGSRRPQDMTAALSYAGFTGPGSVRLGSDGVATVTLKAPSTPRAASVTARVANAPSTLPVLIRPNRWHPNPRPGNPSSISQRGLVGRQSAVVAADRAVVEVHYGPSVITQTSAAVASPGTVLTDLVTLKGADPAYVGPVTAVLYGPFPTRPTATSCTGAPVAGTVTMPVRGDGSYRTPGIKVGAVGYYTWVETLPAIRSQDALRTPCGVASETTVVRTTPQVSTQTSRSTVEVGAEIADRVRIRGTAPGYAATVTARLYGPYASREAMTCTGAPYREVTFAVRGDGDYLTPSVRLGAAGYFTWVESLPGSGLTNAMTTRCGEVTETTLARRTPPVPKQPYVPAGGSRRGDLR
ncbi:hypothetical protein EFK50_19440 [Nocardioides marmoriginsengisoli]|uniref:Big-1 domain-containing protein n=1 Tax=Nocardioides marmoriginsengisoli TaxID=661483 RepID=A0A3N0CAK2_9ACTN|nr:hypothetical protein EFK50_19440 [Nocardioides marmoriginsengisoli]